MDARIYTLILVLLEPWLHLMIQELGLSCLPGLSAVHGHLLEMEVAFSSQVGRKETQVGILFIIPVPKLPLLG